MKEETLTETELGVVPETGVIQQLLQRAIDHGYSFAAWRLPNGVEKKAILSQSITPYDSTRTLEDLPAGFLFSPFDRAKEGLFLKADFLFHFMDGRLCNPETPLESSSQSWLKNPSTTSHAGPYFLSNPSRPFDSSVQKDFLNLTQECIQGIERGDFEKIVPSRVKSVPLSNGFDPVISFQKLCAAYPGALVSLVSIPDIGTWLGASPEILVSVENRSVFKTVALAGTQPYPPGANLKQVAWTQKEIEEQALVSRYIINCFKKIRLREFEEHGPKTVVAGNLMHLKTDFAVDMMATNFPQLGSVMLQLLHPTSAVCGMPLERSLEFLKSKEGYDREFYSGYLGPVNVDNHIHLFVNLRCMQLMEKQGLFYAGSGVTIDSDPEKEWEETEMKMNTLINVIF